MDFVLDMCLYLFVKPIGVKGYLQDRGFPDSFQAQANKRKAIERERENKKKEKTYIHTLD